MADPFTGTMAAIGVGTSILGGINQAKGQAASGEADSRMYAYKAGVAKTNAAIQRQNADYAMYAGDQAAERSGLTAAFTIANQKVAQAASGIDVNSGTAERIRNDTRDIGYKDQTTIREEAGRKAQSQRQAAANSDAEATADYYAGENARRGGKISATGTLIGTASSVASKWVQASQVWGFGGGSGAGYGIGPMPDGSVMKLGA